LLNENRLESSISNCVNSHGYFDRNSIHDIYPCIYLSVMKKIMILLCAGILFQACTPEDAFTLLDNLGFLYDARDHNVYKTVTIGRQTWMAQNLAYLPTVTGQDKKSTSIPCYYVYGYSGTDVQEAKKNPNYKTFGVLYNWPAANIACPEGWRLPDDADWKQLEAYLVYHGYCYDGSIDIENQKVAKSMAAEKEWQPSPVEGAVGNNDYPEMRNKSGFSALPAGFYSFYKEFKRKGTDTFWWGSTFLVEPLASAWYLSYNSEKLHRYVDTSDHGFSVRCIKK
jgi:uncharacterized protein (TIGR02145 family)